MMRRTKDAERTITPQMAYGTAPAVCRDCKFCVNAKPAGPLAKNSFHCIRFRPAPSPKNKINDYDQACGKFEKE